MIEQNKAASGREITTGPLVPRDAFPLLTGRDIAYLDSAASAQKPKAVLDRMRQFYETSYANIHRAVYPLSEAATEAYEGARARVARFLGAPSAGQHRLHPQRHRGGQSGCQFLRRLAP